MSFFKEFKGLEKDLVDYVKNNITSNFTSLRIKFTTGLVMKDNYVNIRVYDNKERLLNDLFLVDGVDRTIKSINTLNSADPFVESKLKKFNGYATSRINKFLATEYKNIKEFKL